MNQNQDRFREFVAGFAGLIATARDEASILEQGSALLTGLISRDDWLPDEFAQPSSESYRQYLLFCDPLERYSITSFVWGAGQKTPIHNHTVWGLIGVLRGAELCHEYDDPKPGRPPEPRGTHRLEPGQIDRVSPTIGDIHRVENALSDRPAISIHVYGANIGAVRRHVFEPATATPKPFVSGYHNRVLPNFW